MPKVPLIFLIAGEASGDDLGAGLMTSLKSSQKVNFAGIGGKAMQAQGLQSLFPMEELSIIGLGGILRSLPSLLKRISFTVKTIQALKPDIVITIDSPEFSFRVMKRLHKLPTRPRLIHYVAPTVWAWRPGRAKKISAFLDHLLCLYPCEPPYFETYGLASTFVGHPIAQEDLEQKPRDPNLLCVLPGSRPSEIKRLLPVFKETVRLLCKDLPDLKVVLPTLPSVEALVREGTKDWPCEGDVVVGEDARHKAFATASAALAASGTVALHLAQAQLPCVIAYKISPVSAWMARRLLKTPWVCMVNILLQRSAIPEYLQNNCTPENLRDGVLSLFKDQAIAAQQKADMEKAVGLLKAPSGKAAGVVLEF